MTGTLGASARRVRAITWARDMLANPATVVLDTETTGLGDDADICDIAIVRVDGAVLLDCLVKLSKPIPPGATAVHGIDEAMVAEAPVWDTVARWVRNAIDGRLTVIYNAGYDVPIIRRLTSALGSTAPIQDGAQCAMLAYADFNGTCDDRFPLGSSGVGQQSALLKLRWWKLAEAAAHLGIAVNGAHRALADALTTLALVRAMAATDDEAFTKGQEEPDGVCSLLP